MRHTFTFCVPFKKNNVKYRIITGNYRSISISPCLGPDLPTTFLSVFFLCMLESVHCSSISSSIKMYPSQWDVWPYLFSSLCPARYIMWLDPWLEGWRLGLLRLYITRGPQFTLKPVVYNEVEKRK